MLLGVPSGVFHAPIWLERLWEQTEDGFLNAGNWMGVRIIGLLHFRMTRAGLLISGREPLIGPEAGFEHLVFALGTLMAVRTKMISDPAGFQIWNQAEIVELAIKAERLGIMTEAWKLRRVSGEPWTSELLQRAFAACEYSPWMRTLHRCGFETKPPPQ